MTESVSPSPQVQGPGYTYSGEAIRHVAMPLGGLGAGQIALCGDGGLRQWQMVNQINHTGFVPDSFFAIRASCGTPPMDVVRLLQSRESLHFPAGSTPLITDDVLPVDQRKLLERFSGVERTVFTGAYPFAHLAYEDAALPVEVSLQAYSPFIPLNSEESGLPAIVFTFTVRNLVAHRVHGSLGAALQNAVGWDGLTPIEGNRCPLYGGNVNRVVRRSSDYTAIVMENASLADDHPGAGQMVLASLAAGTASYERWTTPEQFIRYLEGVNPEWQLAHQGHKQQRRNRNSVQMPNGPGREGETWNGGLAAPFVLNPGETIQLTFILSWYFPNRYVNFEHFGPRRDYGKSRFWLGNAYAARFSDALEVAEYLREHQVRLEKQSRKWAEGLYKSTLPDWMIEALAAQGTFMRSPTCFWAEDGTFFGFEGSLGASTGMWSASYGGSCPLNCTHVWNYEQALSRLFPQLERSMRETEFEHAQAAEGYIPHRVVAPLYLPQFWDVPIGGPTHPALDGMLGAVLKFYREVRQGADQNWFKRLWPRVKRLLEYIIAHWDEDGDGVLLGEQPNTYDIAFYGPNMYIGALWLAALRAGEKLAKLQGESEWAQTLRRLFERGSGRYDELLWNGEYYIQRIDPAAPTQDQYGDGCLADQLFGQWWAHLLDLGYVLPEEHVKTTLRSIVKYNLRHGFRDFAHTDRIFADGDESGLLVCTWPHGGRPTVPVRYCDEVWTGIEYQVGTHCILEGMVQEGLSILHALRQRYDGTRRNPYNEIECGDHYIRAMAGWSMLEAMSGFTYTALDDTLSFAPVQADEDFRAPMITSTGWGSFEQTRGSYGTQVTLSCSYGVIRVQQLTLAGLTGNAEVTLNGTPLSPELRRADGKIWLTFKEPLALAADEVLEIVDRW